MLWFLLMLRRLVVRASAVGRIARMAHVVVAVEGALALAALLSAFFLYFVFEVAWRARPKQC